MHAPIQDFRSLGCYERFKTINIDDEWLIRSELKTLLAQFVKLEISDEAVNVNDAV